MSEYLRIVEWPKPDGGTEVKICQTLIPSPKAEFAKDLIKMGVMAYALQEAYREQTSGTGGLAMEEGIVNRAITITELLFAEMEMRGWYLPCPVPQQGR